MKFSKRISYTLFLFIVCFGLTKAQQPDATLFSVNGNPVGVSEFLYIYGKNNGKEADYSRKSLEEYLELYKRFKLKVAKARSLKLDTIPELNEELNTYKQQVSNSYIMDKEVTEQLIHEVYERQRKDISVKHIFFQLPPNPLPQDTLVTFQRAMKAYDMLLGGTPFGKVVQENSDDRTNINHSGDLGYVTSMLPDGFYEVENKIYSLPVGETSLPVRSNAGYHILSVDAIREARREMEIAQILIKKPTDQEKDQGGKPTADKVYDMIIKGTDFSQMVQSFSEDPTTKSKDGYIGFIGINQFEKNFEDAIFALEKDGDISKPIESRVGWHIIKRMSKKEELPYPEAREKIKAAVEADGRFDYARNRVIDKIKTYNHFKINQTNLTALIEALPADFTSFTWEVNQGIPDNELFSLGNNSYKAREFAQYLKTDTKNRLQYTNGTPAKQVVPAIFQNYVTEKVIQFEQNHLANTYPEFKNLMREYEEGILLFEITRQAVWDKASSDTVGLKKFFEKNRSNYKWKERALISDYTVRSMDEVRIKSIYEASKKKTADKVVKEFDKIQPPVVTYEKDYLEKESDDMKALPWVANQVTPYTLDKEKGTATWRKVEKILPAQAKTLDESRGYVIADYQDFLEKEWIGQLQKEFTTTINTAVFESLIKK
ncbi:MAG: peptidylprolyl isomerase [Saprospiraceae bacterium]|nr:peptidylprolyl isomerase [Saprospiraceae bacterium]